MEKQDKPIKKSAELVKRDSRGRFLEGSIANPHGRPAGATCRALRMARDGALGVALPLLISKAKEGDLDAARVLVAYGLPRQKPMQLPEPIPLPESTDLSELARAVLKLLSEGEVSTDTASEVISMLGTVARVEEVTQLRDQVESLKILLEARTRKG